MPAPPDRKLHDHPLKAAWGTDESSQPPSRQPPYAELHCKTNFSFLRGASHPEELADRAAELGYRALAVTDRNSLAGAVRMHVAAKRRGLKLVFGAEIVPVDAPPAVLLAPTRAAYGRLCRLITVGRRRAIKGDCRITFDDVAAHSEGLIALCLPWVRDGGTEGRSAECGMRNAECGITSRMPVPPSLAATRRVARWSDVATKGLHRYREVFGERAFLAAELCYDGNDARELDRLCRLSREVCLPLVAANDVHYHEPRRRYLQDVLTCIRHQCTIHEAGRRLLRNARRHLLEPQDVVRRFAACPEAVERTSAIANQCTFSLDELRYEYPKELCPEGLSPIEHLARLTWAGAQERYGGRIPPNVRQLLEHELALIGELHYEPYFLTVWDLVRFARGRGILCQGRGSAANSAVCYCLGITAVDPARIDLLFERFVSRERNEPPDIDVDFEHERREEVFQYIYDKYGRDRAAITAEVITYRPRSAVRDVGKALGLSLDCVDALAKRLDWWERSPLPAAIVREAGLDPGDRTLRALVWLVGELAGFPRHLSQHVGGFVMTEGPLCETVPVENGAMPGRTFIEWDKDDLDALGMLKVDCLALGMLTCIRKCFGLIGGSPEARDGGTKGRRGEGIGNGGVESVSDLCGNTCTGTRNGREKDIPRSGCLEEGGGSGETGLSSDTTDATGGALWIDCPDATGRRVGREQHCRGQRSSDSGRLHSLPQRRPRLIGRAGDTSDDCTRVGYANRGRQPDNTSFRNRPRPAGSDPQPPGKTTVTQHQLNIVTLSPSPRPFVPSSLTDVPPEDPAVYDMICTADTVGVFQIESRAQMSMLPRLRPRSFYDLVIEVAIVRPGPIQGGMVHPYLRRRNGQEPVTYPSKALEEVLGKTLGVPLFQEQAMRLAVVAAGFTPGEADQLRRAMAAWRRHGRIEKFRSRLVEGMKANGYSSDFAERCFQQIRGFGEYGFPESHAASFALLVYVSAWLKRYYPAAFAAALINSQPMGFYAPAQIIRDAQNHGVRVLPPDVNCSAYDCTLERRSDEATKRRRDGGTEGHRDEGSPVESRCHQGRRKQNNTGLRSRRAGIPQSLCPWIQGREKGRDGRASWGEGGPALRLGLRLVRGISAPKVRGIEAAQREGPIASIRALARRGDVPRETLMRLAAADAFRSLGLNRREALWQVLIADDEPGLFDQLEPDEPKPTLPPIELGEQVAEDYETIGVSLAAHPISLIRGELAGLGVRPNAELKRARQGQRIAVGGLVLVRQRPGTANGMVFMTLEDETGFGNLIIRPQVWERWRRAARTSAALVAHGLVERQGEVVHVMVHRLEDLTQRLGQIRSRSRDFC